MAVVRRNILSDANTRDQFIRGVKLLKAEVLQPGQPNTYDLFVAWHYQTMMRLTPPTQTERNAAHSGPVFLPWHRHMLIEFERHLQRIPLGDSRPEFGYRSLAVIPWIEVGTTTQQQAIQSVEEDLSRPKAE